MSKRDSIKNNKTTNLQAARKGRVYNNGLRQPVKIAETHYGLGVFAKKGFRKGEMVGIITGDIMDEDLFDSPYCMDLGNNLVLEPRNVWRKVNHSCEPNCELYVNADSKDFRIYVEAIRSIELGDHLTVDYAWPAEQAIPCACLSDSCRGWIVDKRQIFQIRGAGRV